MLVQAAVGESDGYCLLSNEPGSTLNKVVSPEMQNSVKVLCRRLDSFCRTTGLKPDFIKIDTEGFELSVLHSLGGYLAQTRIVLLEMPARLSVEAERIIAYLTGLGFQGPYYCDFANRKLSRKSFSQEDPLFVAAAEMERMRSSAFRFVD